MSFGASCLQVEDEVGAARTSEQSLAVGGESEWFVNEAAFIARSQPSADCDLGK